MIEARRRELSDLERSSAFARTRVPHDPARSAGAAFITDADVAGRPRRGHGRVLAYVKQNSSTAEGRVAALGRQQRLAKPKVRRTRGRRPLF